MDEAGEAFSQAGHCATSAIVIVAITIDSSCMMRVIERHAPSASMQPPMDLEASRQRDQGHLQVHGRDRTGNALRCMLGTLQVLHAEYLSGHETVLDVNEAMSTGAYDR